MEFLKEFQNPPAKYRIKPFWFWNGEMTREEISHQLEEMADKGLGGVFICARQGMTVPYLSKDWFTLVEYACEEAKKRGLEAWLYDEYPYPSGMSGGEVLLEHPEAEHKVLGHRSVFVDGGERVQVELGWSRILHARAYRMTAGGQEADGQIAGDQEADGQAADGQADVCAHGSADGAEWVTDWNDWIDLRDEIGNLQTEKIYQQTGLTKYNNKRFFSYGPKKILRTVLPEGRWRIEVYTEEALGDFKYYGGFFDPCNKEAVRTFIETTHERYRKASGSRFGDSIHGMFSDEVGLLGGIPWSSLLPERFEAENGYSLLEALPALHDGSVPGACRIRYDLYRTVHELFVESYHKQVADWCRENRLAYATEVPSMRPGTQRYSDIIGGDTAHEKLGKSLEWSYDEYIRNYRSNAKAVSSLARQLDREYAMIESFHSVGWTMTIQDAKWMIDRLGGSGINLYNFHAFYYTIADITKHDAPPSQFLQNPYWKHYRKLADYVGRMGVMVSNTEADIRIAVLDPVAALWTKLGNPFHGFPYAGESEAERAECDRLRDSWVNVCKTLLFHQLDYDHLDGEMLQEALVEDGKIRMGRASYSVVVLPPCHCMERGARKKLKEFVEQGGCLIAAGELPAVSIEKEETDEETAGEWRRLFSMDGTCVVRDLDSGELVRICREHSQGAARIEVVRGNRKDVIGCVRLDDEGNRYAFVANQGSGNVQVQVSAGERRPAERRPDGRRLDHRRLAGWAVSCGTEVRGEISCRAEALKNSEYTAQVWNLEDGTVTDVEMESGSIAVMLGGFESRWIRIAESRTKGNQTEGNRAEEKQAEENLTGESQSAISRVNAGIAQTEPALVIPMGGEWQVRTAGDNICRFDMVDMSLDQKEWRRTEVKTFIEQCDGTKLLGQEQLDFAGTFGTPKKISPAYPMECRYRAVFDIGTLPGRLSLLLDRETVAGQHVIRVNGTPVEETDWSPVRVNDQNNRAAEILSLVHTGKNEIEIEAVITQDEDGLRDPFYLWGNFGVEARNGVPVLTALPEHTAPDSPWYRGFPYYSGEICFEKNFDLKELTVAAGEVAARRIPLRLGFSVPVYDCVEVEFNGVSLGVKAYTPYEWYCDTSKIKNEGNRVVVRITNTLANMLDGMYFDYDRHCLVKIEP